MIYQSSSNVSQVNNIDSKLDELIKRGEENERKLKSLEKSLNSYLCSSKNLSTSNDRKVIVYGLMIYGVTLTVTMLILFNFIN